MNEQPVIVNGVPVEQPPASIEDAIKEQAQLLDDLRHIDEQLGTGFMERDGHLMNPREYSDWRRKASGARRHTERRYRFVKQWIREQKTAGRRDPIKADSSVRATSEARALARRISKLESIAIAGAEFARYQTTENLQELVTLVNEHGEEAGV